METPPLVLLERAIGGDGTALESLLQINGPALHSEIERQIGSRRKRMGDGHPALAWNLLCLGRLLFEYDRDITAAEPLVRQALTIQLASKGPDHVDTADCQVLLCRILTAKSAFDEAEPLLRANLRMRLRPPQVPADLDEARRQLAKCLSARGDSNAAEGIRSDDESRE